MILGWMVLTSWAEVMSETAKNMALRAGDIILRIVEV
jgi:hypothetical protein